MSHYERRTAPQDYDENAKLAELEDRLESLEILWMEIRLSQLRTRLLSFSDQQNTTHASPSTTATKRSFFQSPFCRSFSMTFLFLCLTTLLLSALQDTYYYYYFEPFQTRQELLDAVDAYLANPTDRETLVAEKYGWPIGRWQVSQIQDFRDVFDRDRNPLAAKFNESLDHWDVSNATTLSGMFHGAAKFNQDLSHWNVSGVINMDNLFEGATVFNSDITGWDVSRVESMRLMFSNAHAFNQDISVWNISSLIDTACMFCAAEAFSHSLCAWSSTLRENMANTEVMFHLSGCPTKQVPDLEANPPGPFCHVCEKQEYDDNEEEEEYDDDEGDDEYDQEDERVASST